jgi:predicted Fe-Mo cluster-binding NifX family protein
MTVLTSLDALKLIQAQGVDIVIPDTFTSIARDAFFASGIQSVVIPDSVTSIGSSAFRGNQIESVVIPSSVVEIFPSSFDQNVEIIFSDGSIGGETPNLTGLDALKLIQAQGVDIVIQETFTSIARDAFLHRAFKALLSSIVSLQLGLKHSEITN